MTEYQLKFSCLIRIRTVSPILIGFYYQILYFTKIDYVLKQFPFSGVFETFHINLNI